MKERLSEIEKELGENLFVKWPTKAVIILVVLGFSIGLIRETIKTASVV
ncbi:hypothetical protein JXA63_00980 [Candidatus Woesebacteria bacterium]|nr:hypothetical protein [Candidatus Woesebacteria bacterium]